MICMMNSTIVVAFQTSGSWPACTRSVLITTGNLFKQLWSFHCPGEVSAVGWFMQALDRINICTVADKGIPYIQLLYHMSGMQGSHLEEVTHQKLQDYYSRISICTCADKGMLNTAHHND